jgi:hypothetical protein
LLSRSESSVLSRICGMGILITAGDVVSDCYAFTGMND